MRLTLPAFVLVLLLSGCGLAGGGGDVIHRKSVTELSQKAYELMNAGDYARAIGRLESASDLMPKEGSLLYNLALAYQRNEQPKKAVAKFEQFLERFPDHDQATNALKSLAVIEEDLGDTYVNDALALEDNDAHKKTEKDQYEQLKTTAVEQYENALQHYKQLGPKLKPEEQERLREHIATLEKRTQEVSAGNLKQEIKF